MEKILVTGAAGGIGTRMRKLLPAAYKDIRWSDIRKPDDLAANEEFMAADLANLGAVEKIVAGVEGIVLLGRRPVGRHPPGQYHRLLQSVRGGLPRRRQAHGVRLLQSRGRVLSARQ